MGRTKPPHTRNSQRQRKRPNRNQPQTLGPCWKHPKGIDWGASPPPAGASNWLYAAYFDPEIRPIIAEILRWRVRLLTPLQTREVSLQPQFPDFVICTDATHKQETGGIDAFPIRLVTFLSPGTLLHVAHDTIPPKIMGFFVSTLPIFAVGFCVTVPAISQRREIMRDKCIIIRILTTRLHLSIF